MVCLSLFLLPMSGRPEDMSFKSMNGTAVNSIIYYHQKTQRSLTQAQSMSTTTASLEFQDTDGDSLDEFNCDKWHSTWISRYCFPVPQHNFVLLMERVSV